MLGLSIAELLLVIFIVLVVFGATRLPRVGEAMGRAVYQFRKSHRNGPASPETNAKPGRPEPPRG